MVGRNPDGELAKQSILESHAWRSDQIIKNKQLIQYFKTQKANQAKQIPNITQINTVTSHKKSKLTQLKNHSYMLK